MYKIEFRIFASSPYPYSFPFVFQDTSVSIGPPRLSGTGAGETFTTVSVGSRSPMATLRSLRLPPSERGSPVTAPTSTSRHRPGFVHDAKCKFHVSPVYLCKVCVQPFLRYYYILFYSQFAWHTRLKMPHLLHTSAQRSRACLLTRYS